MLLDSETFRCGEGEKTGGKQESNRKKLKLSTDRQEAAKDSTWRETSPTPTWDMMVTGKSGSVTELIDGVHDVKDSAQIGEECSCQVRNFPVTPTPSIFPKVLPYKWGAYCRTNGRRTAVQMGGVLLGFPFFEA